MTGFQPGEVWVVAVVPMRVSKRGSRRASREANGRETRLLVWMPACFFLGGGGFALGWLGAWGQHFGIANGALMTSKG